MSTEVTLGDRIRGKMELIVRLMGNNAVEISELISSIEKQYEQVALEMANTKKQLEQVKADNEFKDKRIEELMQELRANKSDKEDEVEEKP